jgi:cyclopropane fatty-acyl-phospholipid synthase-like methyltransferase
MSLSKAELTARLRLDAYPRSAAYDPEWVLDNLMGPNVLWLAESLCQHLELRPDMRVLDMGCGKAISSIFLAKEFGVQVWANDLWISASDNWSRITAAGLQDRVFPIHAEAHVLPYAEGFFDALVSFDAYHYFGTDDLYLGYYAQFVKSGGQIGIVVPGLQHEFEAGPPDHLAPYWDWEYGTFHSPDWWRRHWERTGKVDVTHSDSVPDGWRQWQLWLQVCRDAGYPSDDNGLAMLEQDAGRNLGFTRMVAQRRTD